MKTREEFNTSDEYIAYLYGYNDGIKKAEGYTNDLILRLCEVKK